MSPFLIGYVLGIMVVLVMFAWFDHDDFARETIRQSMKSNTQYATDVYLTVRAYGVIFFIYF